MYQLKVCNSAGLVLADITRDLAPLDGRVILNFNDYLSSFGTLTFRVQTKSPRAAMDIFTPYKYHVKLYRFNELVWNGIIVDNPRRNHKFIEVRAYTYAWLFSKVMVQHNKSDSQTLEARMITSGTMSDTLTTIFNECKGITSSPIANFTLGTITNPPFPWDLNTTWSFSDILSMGFTFNNFLTLISSFADVSRSDWVVTKDKVLSFVQGVGVHRKDIAFTFGKGGNILDYDSPLDGRGFVNDHITACLKRNDYVIINSEDSDTSTYATMGRLWGSTSLSESLDQLLLNEKGKQIFKLNSTLDSQLSLDLADNAPQIGQFNLGDFVNIIIKDGPINFNSERRIIGYRTTVTDTMIENTSVITNVGI